jgi:hypothetical protein
MTVTDPQHPKIEKKFSTPGGLPKKFLEISILALDKLL